MRTPDGVATLMVRPRPSDGEVEAHGWGPGADWVLDRVPAMLGAFDDCHDFRPRHPVVEAALRAHPHWRMGRTGLVMESLLPAIVEQKVTGKEAFMGFRRLVHRFGETAPGPGAELDLCVQPSPERVQAIASWEWLKLHIDPARSRTLVGRGTSGTLPRADRRARSRRGGPPVALPSGHRRVDQRGGPSESLRRPRCRELRGLPRGEGHRVGTHRPPRRRRGARRSSWNRGGRTATGSRHSSRCTECVAHAAGPACRCPRTIPPGRPVTGVGHWG